MQAVFNNFNKYVDDIFYSSVSAVSINIKEGLNFNNIFSGINSPTGSLIDYNVRVIIYNCCTVGIIVEIALVTLGVNLIANIVIAGLLFFVRYQMKKELNNFWFKRAADIALDSSFDFVDKASQLYGLVVGSSYRDLVDKDPELIAGKDCGPFGLFKTVTPVNKIISKIKFEANIDGDSEEEFNKRIQNLPASSTLFLTLLRINAFLQGETFSQPPANIQQL